jgi:hypothetical protein
MVAVTANDTTASNAMHDELLSIQKELFSGLGLHFKVCEGCDVMQCVVM